MAENEALVEQLNECVEKHDFDGAFALVKVNASAMASKAQPVAVCALLKKATTDRLLTSFLDSVPFAAQPLERSLVQLEKLLTFQQNTLVLSKAWGIGTIRKVDYFYRRITVDFKTKKGHQFTYGAALDMLDRAPEGHILVLRESDPTEFERKRKEQPGEFLKAVIVSNGSSMTLVRLEDYCMANGLVKAANWKAYWEAARAELKQDKCVVMPVKKSEPIEVRPEAEAAASGGVDYLLSSFAKETDPKLILAGVRALVAGVKWNEVAEEIKAKVSERLAYAVTAASKVDDALYARLACQVAALGLANPPAEAMRAYLWERKRYIKAAATLPAREVGEMISFLADSDVAKDRLYAAIPDLCFTAVTEIVSQFKDVKKVVPASEEAPEHEVYPCREVVGRFMRSSQAPATLTTLIVGKIEQFGQFEYADVPVDGKKIRTLKTYKLWKELPSLSTLLSHAIALGEGRRSGETLKMQNLVRRLFGDRAWLTKVFGLLAHEGPESQALFFERFQASIAWDPSTHHTTVVRMTKIVPALEAHLVKVEKKREYARVTSLRSFGLRKAEYLKLINEDMPENVRKIEFAKGFGDLSENAEYQYAKDEQRQLMQKQTLMQAELEAVKPADFADATTEEVMPGVTVVCDTKDGEKVWTILGEWDNDLEMGIISSLTRVAKNMLGKRPGDAFELPDAEGNLAFATVREIRPLSDEVKAWMQLPAGIQI